MNRTVSILMATLTAFCSSSAMAAEKKPLKAAGAKLTHPNIIRHAKGRRLKLGKLELSYLSETTLTLKSAFDRKFRVTFPGRSGSIKVRCNGENVNVVVKDGPVPDVEFSGLRNKTYTVSIK